MENIRLQDIAEALNLSIATVSNVLRGKDNKVSPATKARVMATVEEMGYLPERAEVLMARNPSHLIGLVINDHTQYEGSPIEDPISPASSAACKNPLRLISSIFSSGR